MAERTNREHSTESESHMREVYYRYFLAFLPDHALRCALVRLCVAAGQSDGRVKAEYLHLTLCVIAELDRRDRSIVNDVKTALADGLPPSCSIPLGRVVGGSGGAAIKTIGKLYEVRLFYRMMLRLLAQQQIRPMHRKSELDPHVTLGYDPSDFKDFMLWEWVPGELVLIESEVNRGIHNVLHRWPLLPPRQGRLPFEAALQLPAKRIQSGRRVG